MFLKIQSLNKDLKNDNIPFNFLPENLGQYPSSWFPVSLEGASVKGSFVVFKKAPSIQPLSFFFYLINESGALFGRFDNIFSILNQQLRGETYTHSLQIYFLSLK